MGENEETEETSAPGYSICAITCKNTQTDEAITVHYNFGSTLQETIDKYGEDVVHYHVCKKFATSMRNRVYLIFTQGDEPLSSEKALAEMGAWKPTVTQGRAKKSLTDTALDAYAKMSPEDRKAFMDDLMRGQEEEEE